MRWAQNEILYWLALTEREKEHVWFVTPCIHNSNKYEAYSIYSSIFFSIHSVTDKFTVTTETRSLIGDFKKLFKTIYFGLKGVIDLVLPLYTDLFDVEVEVLKKVIRLFVHHNEPLVDLLDKIVIALASVQRVAVLSFIDIILSTPDESP
uniref:Uncharacterized protein LOC114331173 n=1 Tax=Diabrotica virgifera virgifera TaxID=50390 RepID=A0A6P7FK09_DIAVI